MRRPAPLLVAIAAAIAFGSGAASLSRPVAAEADLRQARSDAKTAIAEQQRLEKAAAEARDSVARLQAEQLAAAQAIAATEAQISAADAELRLASVQLEAQRTALAREQAPVSALLSGLVLTSQRPPILLLASSGSAEELVKLKLLVAATAPAIETRTSALVREIELGSRIRRQAQSSADELRQSRQRLAEQRKAFASLEAKAADLASRRGAQALVAGDIALSRTERLALAEREAGSARESRALARNLAKLGPAPLPKGDAPPPPLDYRLPASTKVIDGLGAVSANGVRSRGVLLSTRKGAALVTPASGTILFAGPFRDYDGLVIIDHGSGWKSVLVNVGTRLRKGESVRIGDPLGIALGPVEVQLHRRGQPVSPALIAGSSAVLSNGPKGG